MRKYSIILLAAALLSAACNKPEKFDNAPVQKLVHRTFTVSAPCNPDDIDTASKTGLASNGLTVNWSADDEINVIGVTADGTATPPAPPSRVKSARTK